MIAASLPSLDTVGPGGLVFIMVGSGSEGEEGGRSGRYPSGPFPPLPLLSRIARSGTAAHLIMM